jgi:hypothetical protein
MDLDDLLEEFKDEQSQAKKKQAMHGKHTFAQQDSATFSSGPVEHSKQGGAKGKLAVNDDPWGDITHSIQATYTHGGLAPPVNKQLYA